MTVRFDRGNCCSVDRSLTITVLSCKRLPLLTMTVDRTRNHFETVEPDIHPYWVCFDNGSDPESRRALQQLGFDLLMLSSENLGQGRGMNQLFASVRTPYFLHLEDDWIIDNPDQVKFALEAMEIMNHDEKIAHVKLAKPYPTDLDLNNRLEYDGPFKVSDTSVPYYVKNPKQKWGGMCFPPAVTRTEAINIIGPVAEEQAFIAGYAESDYSRRFAQQFYTVLSPSLYLFDHIGLGKSCPDWRGWVP